MYKDLKNNLIALISSIIGTIFIVYYIFRASADVVASDYIRIINYYLPDVTDLKYLLSWEGIASIPFTFLARFVNVKFFGYSVFFDKILGALGLFLVNFIIIKYVLNTFKSTIVSYMTCAITFIIIFSLLPWEMILNGTGYAHFITIGLVTLIFYLFDRIVKRTKTTMTLENIDSSDLKFYGNEGENNRLTNMVALIDTSQLQRTNIRGIFFVYILVLITAILFAGSHAVAFLVTLIFFSIIEIFVFIGMRNKFNKGEIDSLGIDPDLYERFKAQFNSEEIRAFGKFKGEKYSTVNNETTFKIIFKFLLIVIISIICLMCFFKSNSTGEPLIPVGMEDITLKEVMAQDPKFPFRFFLKSLASSIVGIETFEYAINFKTADESIIFTIGFAMLFIILVAFVVLILRLFRKDKTSSNIFDINAYNQVFPLMFIVYGLSNYVLVFLSRYKFMRDNYGMSSRYGMFYMYFILGIVLVLSIYIDDVVYNKKYLKAEKREMELSVGYLKKREKLIAEGKIKPVEKKYAIFPLIMSAISVSCIVFILFGYITTTMDEIYKSDYRKIIYTNLVDIAKNYENYSHKDLESFFEYRRNPNHIINALKILEKNNLNVFRENKNRSKD